MTKPRVIPTEAAAMRAAVAARASARYVMRLYITGSTPNSTRALANIRNICEEYLDGRYDLEVLDIARNPALAATAQILAAPTLVRVSPLPMRRFIGDMSRRDSILLGLGLRPAVAKSA